MHGKTCVYIHIYDHYTQNVFNIYILNDLAFKYQHCIFDF